MARKPRVEYEGAVYHVMARGNERREIVRDIPDRERFVETLGEACMRAGWRLHAYVLMPNHYHLLVETPGANLVDGMRWLQGTWTARFNARHRRVGHLFQGRYKALPVEGDPEYFSTVAGYIHLNPARAQLVGPQRRRLEEYAWSSYPHYIARNKPEWLCRGSVLHGERLKDGPKGRLAYKRRFRKLLLELAADERPWEAQGEWERIRRGWYFGSETFAAGLLERIGEVVDSGAKRGSHAGEEVVRHGEVVAERILGECLKKMGLERQDLKRLPKGAAEKVAIIQRLKKKTTASNAWIAERLHAGHPSNVPRYVRMGRQPERGSRVGKLLRMLKCED